MIKLYRKANVCLRVDINFAALTVFNSLVVLSLVFLLSEVVLADEKIKKSHTGYCRPTALNNHMILMLKNILL